MVISPVIKKQNSDPTDHLQNVEKSLATLDITAVAFPLIQNIAVCVTSYTNIYSVICGGSFPGESLNFAVMKRHFEDVGLAHKPGCQAAKEKYHYQLVVGIQTFLVHMPKISHLSSYLPINGGISNNF